MWCVCACVLRVCACVLFFTGACAPEYGLPRTSAGDEECEGGCNAEARRCSGVYHGVCVSFVCVRERRRLSGRAVSGLDLPGRDDAFIVFDDLHQSQLNRLRPETNQRMGRPIHDNGNPECLFSLETRIARCRFRPAERLGSRRSCRGWTSVCSAPPPSTVVTVSARQQEILCQRIQGHNSRILRSGPMRPCKCRIGRGARWRKHVLY